MYDSDQNPFRNLISLALSDSTLLKAILALAARHHANKRYLFRQPLLATFPASSNSDKDALLYKCQAIHGLSLALNDAVSRRQDTIAASIFLLVFLDLLESGCDRWNFHLEGAKNLIASIWPSSGLEIGNEQDPGRTVQAIRSFITRQIYLYVYPTHRMINPHRLWMIANTISGLKHSEQPLHALGYYPSRSL